MASYSAAKSVTATLAAATVDTVTLNAPYNVVTVVNEAAAGVISFTVDGTTPTAGGNNTYNVGPNASLTVALWPRVQSESAQVNGAAGPTWSLAADGTPVPSGWTTALSGSKFARGVDVPNVLTNAAAVTTAVVNLISAGTPGYSVVGG